MNGYGNEEIVIRSPESIRCEIDELGNWRVYAMFRKSELEQKRVHPYQEGLKCSFIERLDDEIDCCNYRIEVLRNMLG